MPEHTKERAATLGTLLEGLPTNWGRFGPEDEVGALNFLDQAEVLRGIAAVRQGRVFTLQVPIGTPTGDPVAPGRPQPARHNVMDYGHYLAGKGYDLPGGAQYCDDVLTMNLQGSTQYDALGHVWYDGRLYNGYDARHSIGGLSKASILPIAERGIVGHGILIDMARHRGKTVLDRGETFDHHDLQAAAESQGVAIRKHDILLIRTGWTGAFYRDDSQSFGEDFLEPGLTFSPELVRWFHEMEIPNLVTDTIGNEIGYEPDTGIAIPLHAALMRNLGIAFTEIAGVEALAEHCAEDGQWTFLYAAAPLKVVNGSGAPVNPIVVK